MPEENNNNNNNNGDKKWYQNLPWGRILMYVVIGVIVIGVIKCVTQLFNSNGPLAQGIGKVLGAAANLINGIVDGCDNQPDCSKGSDNSDDCQKLENCTFQTRQQPSDDGKSNEKVGYCVSSTGTPTGGGISTFGCIVDIGGIVVLCGMFVFPFIKYLASKAFMPDWLKKMTTLEGGKSPWQKLKELVWKAKSTGEMAIEELKREKQKKLKPELDAAKKKLDKLDEGLPKDKDAYDEAKKNYDKLKKQYDDPVTAVEKEYIGRKAANLAAKNAMKKIMEDHGSAANKSMIDDIQKRMQQEDEEAEKEAKDKGMSEDDMKDADNAVEPEEHGE